MNKRAARRQWETATKRELSIAEFFADFGDKDDDVCERVAIRPEPVKKTSVVAGIKIIDVDD